MDFLHPSARNFLLPRLYNPPFFVENYYNLTA